MSSVKFFKVNNLPQVLEPDAVYLKNTAGGLDIHVSDSTGTKTIRSESTLRPHITRKYTVKAAGVDVNTGTVNLPMLTNRIYVFPHSVTKPITISSLKINVTVLSVGEISVGIYSNGTMPDGSDNPDQLLWSVTGLSTSVLGVITVPVNFSFSPGVIYWFATTASSAPSISGIGVGAMLSVLGRSQVNFIPISGLVTDATTYGLPPSLLINLLIYGGYIPGLFLSEA